MTGETLALRGCAPTPLASYLKALGVLRLVSSPANHVSGEAADPHARGWWENECFHLRTTLGQDALLGFFLHDYAPSPIIAPWNGGRGFYPRVTRVRSRVAAGALLMRAVENSECRRLESMRCTVGLLRNNAHLGEYNRLRALAKRLKDASKWLKGEEKRRNEPRGPGPKRKRSRQEPAPAELEIRDGRAPCGLHRRVLRAHDGGSRRPPARVGRQRRQPRLRCQLCGESWAPGRFRRRQPHCPRPHGTRIGVRSTLPGAPRHEVRWANSVRGKADPTERSVTKATTP